MRPSANTLARSGLQQDVINLYRQGVRAAMSKPRDQREAFLTHLRYNFHHPPLTPRDYTAIEYQLRKMSHSLEYLAMPSVQRMSVSSDMREWWANEIERAHARAAKAALQRERAGTAAEAQAAK